MKLTIAVLWLIVLYPAVFAQSTFVPKDTYDRERNITSRVIVDNKTIAPKNVKAIFFSPFYEFEGKVPRNFVEPSISVLLYGAEDVGDEPDLTLTIDGAEDGPYSLSRVENSGSGDETVQQFALLWGTHRLVREIASARSVRGKIGGMEFILTANTIHQIKTIYLSMPKIPEGLVTVYDSSANVTHVGTREPHGIRVKNARYVMFGAKCDYQGKLTSGTPSTTINLAFSTSSPIEKGKALELKIWVDDKSTGPFKAVYVNSLTRNNITTDVLYVINDGAASIIESIAGSTKVKCMFEDIEFSISPESIKQIKLLYQKMQGK